MTDENILSKFMKTTCELVEYAFCYNIALIVMATTVLLAQFYKKYCLIAHDLLQLITILFSFTVSNTYYVNFLLNYC